MSDIVWTSVRLEVPAHLRTKAFAARLFHDHSLRDVRMTEYGFWAKLAYPTRHDSLRPMVQQLKAQGITVYPEDDTAQAPPPRRTGVTIGELVNAIQSLPQELPVVWLPLKGEAHRSICVLRAVVPGHGDCIALRETTVPVPDSKTLWELF